MNTEKLRQGRGIRITVAAVVVFMCVVIAGFVYRIQLPRILSDAELKVNGTYLLDTPREIGSFSLVDHRGQAFTPERLKGRWTLVFFGFTYCPDICPTTLSFLDRFIKALDEGLASDTQIVLVSVDPARDTVEQLANYVPFFNQEFIGVTGEFLDIHRFATALNTPFRKAPGQGESYQVDHSSNVVLVNPRGHYHGFFKAPLDLAKLKLSYRSLRYLWDY